MIAQTGSADHAGYFDYRRRVIGLRPDVCFLLRELPGIPERRMLPSAYAVVGFDIFTLAHEMQHAAGAFDETRADCAAAGSFYRVAARFGIGWKVALRLAAASRSMDGYVPAAIAWCWPTTPRGF